MTTDRFLAEMSERAAKLRDAAPPGVASAPPAVAPAPPEVDAYRQAAAVLHVFDPHTLRPVSTTASSRAQSLPGLITASVPAIGFRGQGLRTLPPAVRLAALTALGSRAAMRAALAANPERERTGVQEAFETWLDEGTFDLGRMRFTELQSLRQLYGWGLERFGELPDRSLVERARAWRSSVRVFEHLVDRNFVGRQPELAALHQHARLGGPTPGPLVISGVGGAGKTALVGRFLIDLLERADVGSVPFAYLPFDAETLDVREPYTVLLAAARQLSTASVTASGAASPAVTDFQRVVAYYRDHRGALNFRASQHASRNVKIADLGDVEQRLYRGFADLLRAVLDTANAAGRPRTPALLVFDTFEEVAYRTREDLIGFWGMLDHLLGAVPDLRVVVAGRPPAAQPEGDRPVTQLRLAELSPEDATSLLIRLGVSDPATASAIAVQVGGNPLSLRLAADVAKAENTGRTGLAPRSGTPLSVQAIGAELVRGRLYRRLLDHIHDPDVRALAHPGMVLRRVTPEVIEQVLKPACGLDVPNFERAVELFDALRAEQALVSVDADGSLRYRDDVRRPVLELLARESPVQVRRIHEHAVSYYARRSSPAERAEELYHRLMLQQPDWQLEDRWVPEVERFIAPAIEELPVTQRRWLAGRMSIQLAPEVYEQAELSEWERLIGRKAVELVRYGDPRSVLELIGGRSDRTADSPLYGIEARVWLDLGELQRAADVLDPALAGYPVLGNAGRLAELLWLRAQAAGDDRPARLAFLDRLRQLVADFRSPVAYVQVLTELLGVLNPDDLADPPDPQAGPLRRDLAAALESLTEDEIGREASLLRLALVRLGPHYPALVAKLAPAVVADFEYLVRRGMIAVEPPFAEAASGGVEEQIETTVYELPRTLRPEARVEDRAKAYGLARDLLDLLKAEKANLAGATLAGIDDYREAWELSSIREVRS